MKENYSLLKKMLLTGILFIFTLLPSMAETFTIGNLKYTTIDETTVSVSKSGTVSGALEIPAQVKFNGKTYSVTNIEASAFSSCSSLTSVSIPHSVTSIKLDAFYGCSSLTSVILNSDTIVSKTYSSKSSISTIFGTQVTSYIFGDSVTSIGQYAFYGCTGLTSITIGNSVTSIGTSAFRNCSGLTSVTIGNSVATIEKDAFFGCMNLKSIYISNIENWCNIDKNNCGLGYNCQLYLNNEEIKYLVIPNTVTKIVDYAFSACISIESVVVPNSVRIIGNNVFDGCSNLESISISDSVESMGSAVFNGCGKLSMCNIPKSLIKIEKEMFYGCNSLKTIDIPNSVKNIGEWAFLGSGLKSIDIPNSVEKIDGGAFYGCFDLLSVTIANSVKNIAPFAFENCKSLECINLSMSLESISNSMFSGCSSLVSINIPNSVNSIKESAFENCTSLGEIVFPNTIKSIENDAFRGCSKLDSIVIPNSVINIGDRCFENCTNLISVIFPNDITKIGDKAFNNTQWYENQKEGVIYAGMMAYKYKGKMPNNADIVIKEGTKTINDGIFRGYDGLRSISIPKSVTYIGNYCLVGCTSLISIKVDSCNGKYTSMDESNAIIELGTNTLIAGCKESVLPLSVKRIGKGAFLGCRGLKSINIPNTVTCIENEAFRGCISLNTIELPSSIDSIGYACFYGCSNLTTVYSYIENPKQTIAFEKNSSMLLAVPKNKKDNYLQASWDNYFLRGIKEITCDFICDNICYNIISGTNVEVVSNDYCGYIGDIIIPENVSNAGKIYNIIKIGNYSFANSSKLYSVYIPNSIVTIGLRAFENCSIISLIIGNGIQRIEDQRMSLKPVKVLWLPSNPPDGYQYIMGDINYVAKEDYGTLTGKKVYPYINSMFEVDGIKYIPVNPSERICDAIDYGCPVENLNLKNRITYRGIDMKVRDISPYFCYGNTSIKYLSLDNDGNIGNNAFNGCISLKDVIMGEQIDTIGAQAFCGCASLTDITIPESVTTIGSSAFYGCSGMKSAIMGNTVKSIGSSAFYGCSNLNLIQFGKAVSEIGNNAFGCCDVLEEITLPESIRQIGDDAFAQCKKLKNVFMKEGNDTLYVGNRLFASCPLDSVYVGRIVSSEQSPFRGNTTLRAVKITDRESNILSNAFNGCTNLQSVHLGDNIRTIGDGVFVNCESLKQFNFGPNVVSIGDKAFTGCKSLKEIISRGMTPPVCGLQALTDINKWECMLYVPLGCADAYMNADQWKDFFFINEKDLSGIVAPKVNNNAYNRETDFWYDLQGRKVEHPSKGIYIHNGKKVLVR